VINCIILVSFAIYSFYPVSVEGIGFGVGGIETLMYILFFFKDIILSIMKVPLAVKKVKLWGIGLLVFFAWLGFIQILEEPFTYPNDTALLSIFIVLNTYTYWYRKITVEQINNENIENKTTFDSQILDEDLSDLEDLDL